MKKIVILISGRGSNMEAIIQANIANAHIVAVISNRADAAGLVFAAAHGITTQVVDHTQYENRTAFDTVLSEKIDAFAPDLVVLAGFMRILTPQFVNHYAGKLLNIHPSLLPAFSGLHTHQRALSMGVKVHGATVHFVTSDLDAGPIVMQSVVPVLDDDTEATLSARVLEAEHHIYPQVVSWFVQGRLSIVEGKVNVLKAKNTTTLLCAPALES